MLKKQTVWLLTMLSLMIVLSVYYMTSDTDDLAFVDNGKNDSEEAATSDPAEAENEGTVDDITNLGGDELYATMRMEVQDDRSMQIDRLEEIVTSSTATMDEKDKALKDIDVLEGLSTKEKLIEQTILTNNEYEDVLVRSDDDKVHVSVKVDQLTNTEVVNIMQLVREEFGDMPVNVNYQPTLGEE